MLLKSFQSGAPARCRYLRPFKWIPNRIVPVELCFFDHFGKWCLRNCRCIGLFRNFDLFIIPVWVILILRFTLFLTEYNPQTLVIGHWPNEFIARYDTFNDINVNDVNVKQTHAIDLRDRFYQGSKWHGYHEKVVPKGKNRFDSPWFIPPMVTTISSNSSRHRYLYSPLKRLYINGLGHNMATINGEVWTSLRLNLTYTHRIARYNVNSVPLNKTKIALYDNLNTYRPFLHVGSVEQLFGWGVSEVPREHIQRSICTSNKLDVAEDKCQICTQKDLDEILSTMTKSKMGPKVADELKPIRVDKVVELPFNLSYGFPIAPSKKHLDEAAEFMQLHNDPHTVFTFPPHNCNKNPIFGRFSIPQRAFFFHKYWNLHGSITDDWSNLNFENESFQSYVNRVTATSVLPRVGRRPPLHRLDPTRLNIAVHARRGDVLIVGRKMLSMRNIAVLIRQIMWHVIRPGQGSFSKLPVSVNIYSEGPRIGTTSELSFDHDVTKLSSQFMDVNGQILSHEDVRNSINNKSGDRFGDLFQNGLEINLRISDNTILSIHEMISADIFIGSESGLSYNVVGSLSRSAFLLMSQKRRDRFSRFIQFDEATGTIDNTEIELMKQIWMRFQLNNERSIHLK